jgi:acid phosphatase class B
MIISFDFDMTLKLPTGQPNMVIVEKFKEHMEKRDKIIIVTSRKDTLKSKMEIEDFLLDQGLEAEEIYHTDGALKEYALKSLGVQLHYDDDDEELKHAQKAGIAVVNAWNKEAQEAFNKYYDLD